MNEHDSAMNLYVPDYYPAFHCIASRCVHTCCAGWEIDIDAESLARYAGLPGAFGDRVRRCVSREGAPHFILAEGERCPLLNGDNLCDLILHEGEGALCQICRDHPRFRNYFSSRVEMGLGLVCEEAARLILSWPHPLRLIRLKGSAEETPTEDEQYLFDLRGQWLSSIQEEGPKARLLETLIFRHLPDALYDGRLEERVDFIRRAYAEIAGGWTDGDLSTLIERARAFSDRVEYDDEALDRWIDGDPA
ncbi:MAG: flagellin lysine-N-methylase [Clostridia bacterium]|nr:flagellin lysine-N-methylase [Clostridia bacterium]